MAEGLGRFHKKNKSTFLMTYCTLSVQYVVVLHLNTCVFENGVQKKIIYLLTETGSTCFDPPAKVFLFYGHYICTCKTSFPISLEPPVQVK